MRVVRTPGDRFQSIPDYPFEPRYVDILDADGTPLKMHYVDEGPRDAPVVLMLHGEPTWSFLYRKVVAAVRGAGLRAVAPDLVGFGRSDKPASRADCTYERHVAWAHAFVAALDLQGVTLVCQDWGGLIGLRLVAEHEGRFSRVLASNTSLPTGDRPPPEAFVAWQRESQEDPAFSAGAIVARHSARPVSAEVVGAYDAPFPDESYKAAARAFPALVPTAPGDPAGEANRRAWGRLERFERPFLTVYGDKDPISFGAERAFQRKVPGAKGQPHRVLAGVGHFIQEDAPDELSDITVRFAKG